MKFSKQLTSFSAYAVLTSAVCAQAPAPPVAPPVPGRQVAQKNLVDPNTQIKQNLEFPGGMTGDIIADLYETWTGKRVRPSKAAMGVDIAFKAKAPITYGEAADLLVKTCFLEGLVFVPSGPNEVKLLPAPNVRKAGGFPLVSDALLLPDNEQLVTYVMSFDFIRPEDAMSIFTGVIAQVDPHGSIVPVPNANALLITENSQLIRTLIQLKERIDIPQELSKQKWVNVYNADADATAESVRTIMEFSAQQNTQLSSGGGAAAPTPATPAAGNRANNAAATRSRSNTTSASTVQVIPDARTNRIFVIGRPIDVEVAEGLNQGFDAPLDKRTYFKHKLKFLAVSDFLGVAQDAIDLATTKTGEAEGGTGGRSGSNRGTTNRSGRSDPNASFSQNNAGGNLAEISREEGPEAVIIGKTLLVADNSNNTLIVQGPPQSIKVVQDLIAEMDVSPEQIQITAVFGRYNLGDSVDFGVDFAKVYPLGSDQGYAAQNRTGVPGLLDPTTLTDVGSFPDVAGFSLYGQLGKEVAATLTALENSGKFHLMARPTVFTTNNRRALLSSGQQVAVPTDTFTQGGSGNNASSSTNIAFRDVLLELEVIPLVNSPEEVTLQISFVNNNIIGETIIDGNSIPTIGQESIVTTVTVPNGETIVLGGLITERDETSESGIPVLMHIPGLKRLFSSIEKDVVREELVIFIQPQIVNGRAQLRDLQKRNADKSQLVRDIQEQATILPPKYGSPEQQEGLSKRELELPWYLQKRERTNQTFQQSAPTENKNRFRGVRR